MLETVKKYIKEIQNYDVEFDQYFMRYVLRVQDQNISEEASYFNRSNILTPLGMLHVVESECERMRS